MVIGGETYMKPKCNKCGRIGHKENGLIINGKWYGPVCARKVSEGMI
jgi:hypothetical protein